MSVGTSRSLVKRTLYDLLAATSGLSSSSVQYRRPVDADNLRGSTGLLEAVWLESAQARVEVPAMRTPLWVDETGTLGVVVQVLAADTGTTQETADQRCDELVAVVVDTIAADPQLGLGGSGYTVFEARPVGWTDTTDELPPGNLPGSQVRIDIEFHVRVN